MLSYTTQEGQERAAVDTQRVSMGLPLTVNVQDFFRPSSYVNAGDDCLELTLQSDLALHDSIRWSGVPACQVGQARRCRRFGIFCPERTSGLGRNDSECERTARAPCRGMRLSLQIISPSQPLSCLFKIQKRASGMNMLDVNGAMLMLRSVCGVTTRH